MRCAYSEPICPRCERIGSCEIYSALREARSSLAARIDADDKIITETRVMLSNEREKLKKVKLITVKYKNGQIDESEFIEDIFSVFDK